MTYGINPQTPHTTNSAPETITATSQGAYGSDDSAGTYGSVGYPVGSQPGETVGFMGAMSNFFRKYTQFSGRASRSEFWWAQLGQLLIGMVLAVIAISGVVFAITAADPATGELSGGGIALILIAMTLAGLVGLALLVPNIAITVRRLHDTNRSGWFYFIRFVPMVGEIVLLVLCAGESDPAGAAYDA